MTTSTEDRGSPCDCSDENHSPGVRLGHKHIGDECIHADGSRHKIHQL